MEEIKIAFNKMETIALEIKKLTIDINDLNNEMLYYMEQGDTKYMFNITDLYNTNCIKLEKFLEDIKELLVWHLKLCKYTKYLAKTQYGIELKIDKINNLKVTPNEEEFKDVKTKEDLMSYCLGRWNKENEELENIRNCITKILGNMDPVTINSGDAQQLYKNSIKDINYLIEDVYRDALRIEYGNEMILVALEAI